MENSKQLTPEQLEAIRQRAEKATEGPWRWEKFTEGDDDMDTEMPSLENGVGEGIMYFGDCEQYYPSEGTPPNEADAEFIAHARDDIPELLSLVAQQQAEVARLQSQQERLLAELRKADESYEALEKRYICETMPAVTKEIAERLRKERGL